MAAAVARVAAIRVEAVAAGTAEGFQ